MKFTEFLNEAKERYTLVAFIDLNKDDDKDVKSALKDNDDKELIKILINNYEVENEKVDSLEKQNIKNFKYKEYHAQYNDVVNTISLYEVN